MKHVVMGTSGHIDHGKTALVKRLTGVDTDRLEEEKRRGMTIELGFAPLALPSGNIVSIIDVPGHEKFIRAMVSGATGMDFVLLVIAADEGVMPQTREHLEILSMLNIRSGIVALTKADLVESDWVETVRKDVQKMLETTPLKGADIISVSSVTGEGIDELIQSIDRLAAEASSRKASKLFRMPVDRIFSMTGHGTVVTGTIYGGIVKKGESIEVLPNSLTAKVRGIQVHKAQVDTATAGDRCAMNIIGIEKEEIARGDVIAHFGMIQPIKLVDAVLRMVQDKGGIEHNQRVHVHLGTKEVLARIRVLDKNRIEEGESGYVQIRFEEPVIGIRGDRFIIRSYSPIATLGGGVILFHDTVNRKRFDTNIQSIFEIAESGTLEQVLRLILLQDEKPMSVLDFWHKTYEEEEEIRAALNRGIADGWVKHLHDINKYVSSELVLRIAQQINSTFEKMYAKQPFKYQIEREEIRSKIFTGYEPKDFQAMLNMLAQQDYLVVNANAVYQSGDIRIDGIRARTEIQKILAAFSESAFTIKSPLQCQDELDEKFEIIRDALFFLKQAGSLIEIGDNLIAEKDQLKKAILTVRQIIDAQGSVSVGELRDGLSVGRKATIALLEYLDKLEVTKREGNQRKPGAHYMDAVI